MLFGLGLGLVVAAGAYFRAPWPARTSEPARAAASDSETPDVRATPRTETAAAEPPAPAENRFQFYEILPQFEVTLPDEAPAATTSRARRTQTPAPAPGSYLLQAGSFSASADAERLKAQLALLGFESHVQPVTIDDDVFNRVRIGPIADLEAAKRTQRQLRDAGIDSLLMRVPK